MSGQLRVAFASDMPAATVEVVSPELEVIERFMLDAGRSRTVAVPSEASFLRVHLPSGRVVTLEDPGNLSREVSMEEILTGSSLRSRSALPGMAAPAPAVRLLPDDVEPSDAPTPSEMRLYHRVRSTEASAPTGDSDVLPLGQFGNARLIGPGGDTIRGVSASRSREAHWDVQSLPIHPPYQLRLEQAAGSVLVVRVPGNVRRVWARADVLREQRDVSVSVRIQTTSDAADAIAGYLQRGDCTPRKPWPNGATKPLTCWSRKSPIRTRPSSVPTCCSG